MSERIPILYLAPWVGYGGSDKNTIDWFRWIDRDRFAPFLITTQPSENPLIDEVAPYAEEVWVLPDLMPAEEMPAFIFDFLRSRDIRVIHLMNSRLGFDLLPDLSCLPNPPSVVVQLHVEEVDKSGYVRYVTTRYGNLVDRFSISNEHVAEAVRGYGVPAEKIEVIYTGVDAEQEFSPQLATPVEGLADDRLQILFAVRLTDQKDPLLMVEIAAGLRDRGVKFQVNVVGEGELEDQIKARVAELRLEEQVVLHPASPGLRDWYAACDVFLLTSKFEGVPCVLFETMAMGMPIVAPALPGIRELLHEEGDTIVAEHAPAEPYVEALVRLAEDEAGREALGRELRERAQRQFSVQEMAAMHGEIYQQLCDTQEPSEAEQPAPLPEPIRFLDRSPIAKPLVSVLIPHFNQARFLRECVESVREQTYPSVEIVVVDDASTEAGTDVALEEIGALDGVTLIRLAENGGPSRARNAGLQKCQGRYILPVDSDNLLLPEAIENLVTQLGSAGEDIGFVYPNLEFFGNREEYHEAPEYNLFTLLHANFCDTCSLLDREIFDAGIRYREEIKLGHEDWEFALQLAARGIRGEPANGPTVRYRKWGFNRSDMVDHGADDFREDFLAEVSPFKGHEAAIKAQESPALSLVALTATAADSAEGRELLAALSRQSCVDLELVADVADAVAEDRAPSLRRFPVGDPAESLQRALGSARGSFVVLTGGSGADLLADPAFAEKVLRRFEALDGPDAIVLTDAGSAGRFSFASAAGIEDGGEPAAHAVIWRRAAELDLPYGLLGDPAAPVASVVRLLSGAGARVEWRHLPGAAPAEPAPAEPASASPPASWRDLPADPARANDPHGFNAPAKPLLPGRGKYEVARWGHTPTWIAPLSTVLIRYCERIGERRLLATGEPPPSFELERFLGAARSTGVQGTKKLIGTGGSFAALPREEWREMPADALEIGYLEEAPLPGLDAIALAVHRGTGQHVLVSLPDDNLLPVVDVIEHLGFADPFPLRPREVATATRPAGLVGLLKAVDVEQRRHRYAIGGVPGGELIAELGGLAESGLQGSVPVWIADDYVITDRYRPPMRKPGVYAAIRWATEPVGWRDLGTPSARAKVMLRRSAQSAVSRRELGEGSPGPEGDPVGWLFASARPGLLPLYASHHPVTGDQLLTRTVEDAVQMGYEDSQLLGFVSPAAPHTKSLDRRSVAVPWARRSGHVPQSA